MSVVGIDLGGQSTKIGVARNEGIDIVRINCPSAQFPSGKSRIRADSGLFFFLLLDHQRSFQQIYSVCFSFDFLIFFPRILKIFFS